MPPVAAHHIKKQIKQVSPAQVRYKFNSLSQLDKVGSKELDKETGLYYYGARYYDPVISYFLSIDPLAEKYFFQSPYVYAENNPVVFRDIKGMGTDDDFFYNSKTGETKIIKTDDKTDNLYIDGKLFQSNMTKGQLGQGYTNILFGMKKPMNITRTFVGEGISEISDAVTASANVLSSPAQVAASAAPSSGGMVGGC